MEDPEVVAAIVAGDPAGLAEACDRYAMPLYAYCRSMLREPADAADAVQDTFLVAAAKLRDLREPGRLRPWLYAIARNECLRRVRAGTALPALDKAADIPAGAAEVVGVVPMAALLPGFRDQVLRVIADRCRGGITTTPVAVRSPGAPDPAGANPATSAGNSPSVPSSPGTGTLSASTGRLDLVSVKGTATGTFTLTATGGPVSAYSITVGSSLVGHLSVSASSGSLAAGASVTITVTSTSLVALDGQLTVNPGGHAITVVVSISL